MLGFRRVVSALVILSLGVAALLLASRPAAASTCEAATEIDYEAPLADLPALPPSTTAAGLKIGPPRLRLYPVGDTLNTEGSRFGFELTVDRQVVRRPVSLDGFAELELDRVGRHGQAVESVVEQRQGLGIVASPAFNGRPFLVSVPAKPGLYLFRAQLRDRQGKRVGRYADYLRVVSPVADVRLVIGAGPIRPGSRTNFWVENRGTQNVDPMGAAFAFEVFEGGVWSKAPGSPRVFPKLRAKPLSAGGAGGCTSFQIPSEARPGLYRYSKDVVILNSGVERQLTAKFRVSSR